MGHVRLLFLAGLLWGALSAPAAAAPNIVSARFAERPVAGVPATLEVQIRDPFAAVNGLRVDFGDGSFVQESACRPVWSGMPGSGPFTVGKRIQVDVTHVFTAAVDRTVRIVAMAGDCTRGLEVARTQLTARVRTLPAGPTRAPARIAQASGCDGQTDIDVSKLAPRLLCLVNALRASKGLPVLRARSALRRAARRHARDMVARGYFSHVTPEGRSLVSRLRRAGARIGGVAGENLAAGTGDFATPMGILLGWLESPPHTANLYERDFRRAGMGVAAGMPGESATDAATVVLVFAG